MSHPSFPFLRKPKPANPTATAYTLYTPCLLQSKLKAIKVLFG